MCASGCLRWLSLSILSIETGCLNPELFIPGSLASHLVHWITHLHVSGTGLQVGCHTHLVLHGFGGLTLLTRALPLSRLLSPDLNTEIHFWAFFQALLSLSPKWSTWLLFVSELSCLTENSFTQLDMKSILRSEFCTKWKGIPLYLIKLFDHVIAASYIPKNFSPNPWRNDAAVCSLLWVGFSQKFGLGCKACSKIKTGQEPVSCIWK